jgi:Tol biopolymer transport system component
LTFEGRNLAPVWTPDGRTLCYATVRGLYPEIFCRRVDRPDQEEKFLSDGRPSFPASWSPDGKTLAFVQPRAGTGMNIYVMSRDGDRAPRPFAESRYAELHPAFSPDGRRIAYASKESGAAQVYVQPFPGPGGRWLISADGGGEPVWSRDGRELFYRSGDRLMAVTVGTDDGFQASEPSVLFEKPFERAAPGFTNYDVDRDGERFVMVQGGDPPAPDHLRVVLDWFQELESLVPADDP